MPRLRRCSRAIQSVALVALLTAAIFLTLGAAGLSAQAPAKRQIYVSVTDPQGRIVTGLDRSHFEVVENGVPRSITDFAGDGYPVALAIVSAEPLSSLSKTRLGDELIQTQSLSSAIRHLEATSLARKVIVATSSVDARTIPSDIQLIRAESSEVPKTLIRLSNQYWLEFDSHLSSTSVEVVVARPVGMPSLTASWN